MDRSFQCLFKTYFFGLIVFTVFFSILMAILHPFGWSTVTWNGQEVTGVMAYILPFFISVVFSFFFSIIIAFFAYIGYYIKDTLLKK